jgi:hypothetical protein
VSPYDRTGDPIDDEPCGCDGGWIDRDADHPVPCITCRPHLAPAQRHRRIHGNDIAHPSTPATSPKETHREQP